MGFVLLKIYNIILVLKQLSNKTCPKLLLYITPIYRLHLLPSSKHFYMSRLLVVLRKMLECFWDNGNVVIIKFIRGFSFEIMHGN